MVQFVNLNRNLKNPADKAVFQGKNPANKTTGPNTGGFAPSGDPAGLADPWRATLDKNPLNEDFYQSSYTFAGQSEDAQRRLDGLQFEFGNSFEEGNNAFASEFVRKYAAAVGGANTAEGKEMIERDRIVRPENLAQLSSQPATGGNAVQDPNVAGKFPSQEVNV
tara:strand:- start:77 stop:571 length:495 start_codon:yes stop_codon:yes gene_type:complete